MLRTQGREENVRTCTLHGGRGWRTMQERKGRPGRSCDWIEIRQSDDKDSLSSLVTYEEAYLEHGYIALCPMPLLLGPAQAPLSFFAFPSSTVSFEARSASVVASVTSSIFLLLPMLSACALVLLIG